MKPFDDLTISRLTSWLEQEDDFVFLESSRVTENNYKSFLFLHPRQMLVCNSIEDGHTFLEKAEALRQQGAFLAGWIGYELGYLLEPHLHHLLKSKTSPRVPLAVLGVYDAPLVFNHRTATCENGRSWPGTEAPSCMSHCSNVQPSLTQEEYLEAVQAITEYIHAGDCYQVNFTLHLDFHFQGSVAHLYRRLRKNQSVEYGAWIRRNGQDVLSFSPELFFEATPEKITVRPMKGTMVRGKTTEQDRKLQRLLATDEKNRSENIMIVDLLRNDLARLLYKGGGGQVVPQSLFDVEIYESLLQMTSTITAIPADNRLFSLAELIPALFPCGSVTGAPKIRTMEIIKELEKQKRGVYCGAIGYAGSENICFNVPIRTVELTGGHGRMGIGSGVVADSDPEAEWQECLLKGNFLSRPSPDFQLIETLLWQPESGYFLFEFHLERLADSARYFHFFHDQNVVEKTLEKAVTATRQSQRVRLLLFRDGRCKVTVTPIDDAAYSAVTPEVMYWPQHVKSDNPVLYHKTTQRELFDKAYAAAVAKGCIDAIFTNEHGEVTEGAITNIFISIKGKLFTPPLVCGLLAGTYRRMLLEEGRATEKKILLQDVLEAEEVYVANSVRGLIKVQVRELS
jgi:para-aminobenzoate synthetase/4-amino-4-deoxychorismate lyase